MVTCCAVAIFWEEIGVVTFQHTVFMAGGIPAWPPLSTPQPPHRSPPSPARSPLIAPRHPPAPPPPTHLHDALLINHEEAAQRHALLTQHAPYSPPPPLTCTIPSLSITKRPRSATPSSLSTP